MFSMIMPSANFCRNNSEFRENTYTSLRDEIRSSDTKTNTSVATITTIFADGRMEIKECT